MVQFNSRFGGNLNTIFVEIVGYVATALVTGAYIPGVVSVWRLRPKPATAISLPMYITMNIGVILWLIYGICIHSWPVIVGNIITMPLALSILVYKYLYG